MATIERVIPSAIHEACSMHHLYAMSTRDDCIAVCGMRNGDATAGSMQ